MKWLRWPNAGYIALVLFVLALVARIPPGDFWTPDEAKHWSVRVEAFRDALRRGDLPETNQSGHPGVTTMWLGAAGSLAYHVLADWGYVNSIQPALSYIAERDYGRAAMAYHTDPQDYALYRMLLRLPIAIVTALWIPLLYLLLWRLLDSRVALLAALLNVGDPILVAHGQVLHLDALLTAFMSLSMLAALVAFRTDDPEKALEGGIDWRLLVASAIAGGLAFLTKSPSVFIIPIIALAALISAIRKLGPSALIHAVQTRFRTMPSHWKDVMVWHIAALAVWGVVALAVWIVLWPAAWVDFPGTVQSVMNEVSANGFIDHVWGNFFLGRPVAEPGLLHYPVALVLRLTPWTMLGILALLLGVPPRTRWWSDTVTVSLLVVFALMFLIVMGMQPKQFDRYLLPIFPALNIVAAVGWFRLAHLVRQVILARFRSHSLSVAWGRVRPFGWALIALLLILNLDWYRPYYLAYYNPLLGGGAVAERSIYVGWGEGLDEAGRYIAAQPDGCDYAIASWYELVILPYVCSAVMGLPWAAVPGHVNYVVLYSNQMQRNIYPDILDLVPRRGTLVHTVRIHGVNYASIYQMPYPMQHNLSADFGPIRLAGYTIDTSQVQTSGILNVSVQWQSRVPIAEDYLLFVHIFDALGNRVGQTDAPPAGPDLPTSRWQLYHYNRWQHPVPVPAHLPPGEYWISIGLYEPHSFARLSVQAPPQPGAPDDGADAFMLQPVPIGP